MRPGPIQRAIEAKVRDALAPTHLEIFNESHMHSVPPGSESHFRLFVVSEEFEGKPAVQRHQAVYRALAEEMRDHIHALGLQTLTPAEWAPDAVERTESPDCLGGGKSGR
jgi:BolA protein